MAATFTQQGLVVGPSGPVNGAVVNLWNASRFPTGTMSLAQDAAAPAGSADAGPVTTGTTYGGPGQWAIAAPQNDAYFVAVTYGGHTYWTYVPTLGVTDQIATTVAAGSTGASLTSLIAGSLDAATTTGFSATGRIFVWTSGGLATLSYTSVTGGGTPSFNGIQIVSGTGAWTVATGNAITSGQRITTLNQTLDDGSGDSTIAGTLTVVGAASIAGRLTLNNRVEFGTHTTGSFTTTNTAGVQITGLAFNIAASEVVYFEGKILASSASAGVTYGSKYAVTAPTGCTGFFTVSGPVVTATTTAAQTTETTLSTLAGPFAETSTAVVLDISGVLINGTTAGTAGILLAAATTTSTVTAGTGSFVTAFQIT